MKKNKTETKKLQDAPAKKSALDYSQLLPLLSASLGKNHNELVAYSMVPAKGHGFAFATIYGKDSMPQVGVFDIAVNSSGELLPGAFDAFVSNGTRSYSQTLGFFERFASEEYSQNDIAELFGK